MIYNLRYYGQLKIIVDDFQFIAMVQLTPVLYDVGNDIVINLRNNDITAFRVDNETLDNFYKSYSKHTKEKKWYDILS